MERKYSAADVQAAIEAGYWITKDHGRWYVGRGSGYTSVRYPTKYLKKGEARTAMCQKWEESK